MKKVAVSQSAFWPFHVVTLNYTKPLPLLALRYLLVSSCTMRYYPIMIILGR